MSTSELTALTASEAIEEIRSGRLSAEEYVSCLIKRARNLSSLNALISIDDGAIIAARRVDQMRAAGNLLPPLAGLPIVVKDNINTSNLPTTGGTPALEHFRPASNAPILQKLIDAGAIVFGKANMHELAFGATSTNLSPFAGIVKNPYDVKRVPGGSSGGTGAAVAARIAPVGLGTDTGGSVREPASLCGVAGLRPSVGNGRSERRYDASGVLPISSTRDTVGPLARTMADIALLDAVITDSPLPDPASLSELRLGIPASFWSNMDAEVEQIVHSAKTRLKDAGVTFVEADLEGLAELTAKTGFPIALHEAHVEIPEYLANNGLGGMTLADIARVIASPDVKPIMDAVIGDVAKDDYENAVSVFRPQMQAIYARYFEEHRVAGILFPTMLVPAPLIDEEHGSTFVSINNGPPEDFFAIAIRNTDAGSTAGIPGITVPAGLTTAGLPVGIAVDGPIGSDSKLIGIGMSIEVLLGPLPAPEL